MRPAGGPDQDIETVRRMREATGADFDLMIDAHTWWRMGDRSYDAAAVERIADAMAEHNIAWLEEPLPPHDHDAYFALKEKGIVPLAAGEHENSEAGFLDLIRSEAVDYVQMDVCCQGGYTLARRVFAEVASEGLRFAFHSWGTALEVIAAAQVGICQPDTVVEWLEYPCYATESSAGMYPFPLASEILKDPLQIEKSYLVVPTGPGLGVAVDESVIERYPWKPGPWSFFRIDSPRQTLAVTSDHSIPWGEETA
jgi:L-alanine-DL-glutamate epimerase-like enolase superfamily enzyme